jgi:hypothetical protein
MARLECPQCGDTEHTWRDEVDVGVGVICGPLRCDACRYSEDWISADDFDRVPENE